MDKEFDSMMGRMKSSTKRLNGYCDTYARSKVQSTDIKRLKLIKAELDELITVVEHYITYRALGGTIDDE